MNRQQANQLMSMQSLAARQAWRGLVRVARARLSDLEYQQSIVNEPAAAKAIRIAIDQTRGAIQAAEIVGDA